MHQQINEKALRGKGDSSDTHYRDLHRALPLLLQLTLIGKARRSTHDKQRSDYQVSALYPANNQPRQMLFALQLD